MKGVLVIVLGVLCFKGYSQNNWKFYTDTIANSFTINFNYPQSLVAESIQNGRCIGTPIKKLSGDDEIINTMDWCIWMGEIGLNIEEKNINSERKNISAYFIEMRDSVLIAGTQALHITFKSKDNIILKELFYFKKNGTQFEIVCNNPMVNDFQYFLNSIRINKL